MGEGDRTSFIVYTEDGIKVGLTSGAIVMTDGEVYSEGEYDKMTAKRWFLERTVRELKRAKETRRLVLVGSEVGSLGIAVTPEMKEVIDNLISFTEQLLEIENEKAKR